MIVPGDSGVIQLHFRKCRGKLPSLSFKVTVNRGLMRLIHDLLSMICYIVIHRFLLATSTAAFAAVIRATVSRSESNVES